MNPQFMLAYVNFVIPIDSISSFFYLYIFKECWIFQGKKHFFIQ